MPDSEPQLVLPETNLQVTGTELIRLSDEGEVVFRAPLETIQEFRTAKRLSPFAAAAIGSGSAIGYIGFYVAVSNIATVLLSLLALLVITFGLFSLIEIRIKFRSRNQNYTIAANEPDDVVLGFVNSAQPLLGKKFANPNA